MEEIDFNKILNRELISKDIKNKLIEFQLNKNELLNKRGFYIYGKPGCGKTEFIMSILKELDYDIIKFDSGDIRNKAVIDTITKNNISDKSVYSLLNKKVKKIVILMDEIDGMNNGDKGGINSLIKLIRPKKNKRQKLEDITYNPIICISNNLVDKKIKELMNVCHTFELKIPTNTQMKTIMEKIMPCINENTMECLLSYLQGDMRKMSLIYTIYKNNKEILSKELIENIFTKMTYNNDTKYITKNLINNTYSIDSHLLIMNETDRTIVGLLLHENIIDILSKYNKKASIPFYLKYLDNICFADYIDRITFQKQIWQFNEMSSLIKTLYSNHIYHKTFKKKYKYNPTEVRFTKVLTKYSTEYNNNIFIQGLCQKFGVDDKDLFSFFLKMKNNNNMNEISDFMEKNDITKLEINRIYRYIDKYIKNCDNEDDDNEDECEDD